ncbi:CBS domain-containing protein [Candidatus Leptofilum sp.]|uniref:CBS domain-containing protein n=1 Tax=Candidatus Leptofilum sp. TaxID=3241576 RepID=UPI003B5C6D22
MKVSTILATKGNKLYTIAPAQAVSEAVAMLATHNIGVLLVLAEGDQLAGIISERDIVRHLAKRPDLLDKPVASVMTSKVITCLPQDDLMSVAHVMTERRFRHLPVVEDGELLGMISIGDVLKAQRDYYHGQIDTLETQILATE